MNEHTRQIASEPLPAGMAEYEARTAIRTLVRLYGFEMARELVANYLNDEAENRRQS